MASGGYSSGFSSGFRHADTATVSRPTFVSAPPRPTVALAVEFMLVTHMSATVTADDEALGLALLGLPGDNEGTVALWLLLGPH